jgi:hypothetical protein
MAEAEAAQQALLTSGKLAERAQENSYLKGMLVTYLNVQRLYHKAMLPHIQRHQQLSGTPAGLAYAMLCDVLAQPPAKRASSIYMGDKITSKELQQLVDRVQQLPPLQARHPVALLAVEIAATLASWPDELSTINLCVMQDVISLLGGDQLTLLEATARPAGGLSGLWKSAVSKAGQFAADTILSAEIAMRRSIMENALVQACKPPDSPPEFDIGVALTMQLPSRAPRCDGPGRVARWLSALQQTHTSAATYVSTAIIVYSCVHAPVLLQSLQHEALQCGCCCASQLTSDLICQVSLCLAACSIARAAALAAVYDRALDTLMDAADRSIMTTGLATLNDCFAFAHINPLATCASLLSLGTMSHILCVMCAQTAVCSMIHNTAMRQLEGELELGDWEAAIIVSVSALVLCVCCNWHLPCVRCNESVTTKHTLMHLIIDVLRMYKHRGIANT